MKNGQRIKVIYRKMPALPQARDQGKIIGCARRVPEAMVNYLATIILLKTSLSNNLVSV